MKNDLRYFKDAYVDTILPMHYHYFHMQRTIKSFFNFHKIRFHDFSVIEECSINDVFTREKYWIATLNSYINGYNETRGGEGNPKYDYELIYQKFKSGMSQKEIALELNCDKHTITRALKSFGVPEEETIKGKYGNSRKAVLKIDINTNRILKEFSSMTEAAKHENCSVASISRICNNKQNLNKNYTYIKLGDYRC